jgi:hypothetical protein
MFISVEVRKKLCRIGKRKFLSEQDSKWMIKLFSPKKPGRPKTMLTLKNNSTI